MRLKNFDLVLAIFIVLLNMGWLLLPSHPLIGVVLVIPLVFVLPGYTLTAMIAYRRSPEVSDNQILLRPDLLMGRSFDGSDRLILSLGLSLAIDVLVGFILNMLPIGFQSVSWAVSLGLLTVVFALITALLRRNTPERKKTVSGFHLAVHEGILLVLAMIIVLLSIQFSVFTAQQQPRPGFSQLWMLQSDQAKNTCSVHLGMQSFEATSMTYRVILMVDGKQMNAWSEITLAPKQVWEQQVPLIGGSGKDTSVEAQLYRVDGSKNVYRDVHLTFHLLKGGSNGQEQQCVI